MANALALPHILEITFDALTAAVGIVVILLALRVGPTLTLFAHRRALRVSIVAAALIVAAQVAEVWADISRASPIEDAAADLAELITVCLVGLALHLMGRAERGSFLLAEGGQRGSPDRFGQSILLPPGGGAADRALQEKRPAPLLRRV
jgi:hypothetical protein